MYISQPKIESKVEIRTYQFSHIVDILIIANDYDAGLWKVFVDRHDVVVLEQAALPGVNLGTRRVAVQSRKSGKKTGNGWESK